MILGFDEASSDEEVMNEDDIDFFLIIIRFIFVVFFLVFEVFFGSIFPFFVINDFRI
jgi:hypothetical protein